jgi:hypothetical protein
MAAFVRIAEGAGMSMKIPRVLINRAGTTGGCGVLHPLNKGQIKVKISLGTSLSIKVNVLAL